MFPDSQVGNVTIRQSRRTKIKHGSWKRWEMNHSDATLVYFKKASIHALWSKLCQSTFCHIQLKEHEVVADEDAMCARNAAAIHHLYLFSRHNS